VSDDDREDKSLAPSSKRLADAREEGQVPRARELATLLMLAASTGFLLMAGGSLLDGVENVMRSGLMLDYKAAHAPDAMSEKLASLVVLAFITIAPLLIVAAMGAVVGNLAIGGWNFTTKPLGFKFERLNPLEGIKRLGSIHTVAQLGKGVLAVILVGTVAAWFIKARFEGWIPLIGAEPQVSARKAMTDTGSLLLWMILPMIVVGGTDALLNWWRHHRDLRMTPEEAKREAREAEGNPEMKGKIRQQQREMARRRMMQAVPKADVVITNPTHYAVALSYSEGKMRAPRVVAKGVDLTAARIRGIAAENKVMLVEAPPLARALFKHAEIDDEIPAALYGAVAQVLAYVFQIRAGMRDAELGEVEVPPGLDPNEVQA
jgi:flagellar biosynthetic protein FlhB